MSPELPIHAVLADIRAALAQDGTAVLIAPPGAGKTTAVAPALLNEPWCSGEIILTSPRRLAARAAAERMAEMLGERAGETVGYQTRMDSKVSGKTRIRVVTEAILVNRLMDDPELEGVSAIILDEAHERQLDSDFALALALETRGVLREDLRLLVMSATIDGARFAQLLGSYAQVIESEGRSFPLKIRWVGSDPSKSVEEQVADATRLAWREEEGDILVFLPGVGEIERTRRRLEERLPDALVLPLHGQIDPAGQRAAIRRDPGGRRRIVLATSIAETSLTLDGVSVVIDSGLARLAEYDLAAGSTRLVTRRASQAASAQRAGRAARQGPGIAYRLWKEGGHLGRPEFAPPEIENADLSGLLLALARWGTANPGELNWLDKPPSASIQAAKSELLKLGGIDEGGRITPVGRALAAMPMAPSEAAAVLFGAKADVAEETAQLVMLLQERGLGGRSEDLGQRLRSWQADRSKRAQSARRICEGWAKRARAMVTDLVDDDIPSSMSAAGALALARPDFVAKPRGAGGEYWLSAGGRGYRLDPASSLAGAEWIVIGDAQGTAKDARITAALALDQAEIEQLFESSLEERTVTHWNSEKERVDVRRERRLGAIRLSSAPDPNPDPQALVDILVDKALEDLGKLFPPGFLYRASFAGIEALGEQALRDKAALWLAPLFDGRRDLNIPPHQVSEAALAGTGDWSLRQNLDRLAPTHFVSPAETRHAVDYTGEDAPSVEVRVQALFGLDTQPMIGEGASQTALLLKLTSPAGRPIQATRDLPGFWRGSWTDVVRDMKGRYPKHRWPDEPWNEKPSLKTKNAFNRS